MRHGNASKKVVKRQTIDMAKIGPSSGTKGEVMLNEWFGWFSRGTVNNRSVYGTPDLTLEYKKQKFALFVDGRFWHDPRYAKLKQRPHHRVDWEAKAKSNRRRDHRVNRRLTGEGFVVVRVWDECFAPARMDRTHLILTRIILLDSQPGDRWSVSGLRARKAPRGKHL